MGKAKADSFFKAFRVVGWVEDPSAASDEPIITPKSTGDNGYGKPALGYLALKELLGDARYRKALHQYMDEWHGKHPSPWDYFNTFNRASGENLDWFWQRWFFEPNYIDIGISDVATTGNATLVTLANVGGMPAPVDLVVRYADGTSETLHQTPAIWRADPRRATVTLGSGKKPQSITLAHGIWMDADTTNDRWTTR
jgi:aminopeptidase N